MLFSTVIPFMIQYNNEVSFSTVINQYNYTTFFLKNGKKFITDFKTESDEIDSDKSLPDIPPPLDKKPKLQAKDDKKFTPSPLKKPIRYI